MHERLHADKNIDFDGYTNLIFHLINQAWGANWGTFTEDFPNGRDSEHVSMPVITYMLKEMQPAALKNGTREIKPRLRDTIIPDQSIEGNPESIEIYGQMMEHTVVFEVWEENNQKATALAKRFRDFMRMYTGFFMQNGVQQMIFSYQNTTPEVEGRDNLVCRKLVYQVRLEDQFLIPTGVIEKVTASVRSALSLSDDSINKSLIDFKLP